MTVPVCLTAGWYDIFLPGQLRDFRILRDAGRGPRLTVGPWTHNLIDGPALEEAIERAPVRTAGA